MLKVRASKYGTMPVAIFPIIGCMRSRLALVATFGAALVGAPASAQSPDIIRGQTGEWLIVGDDGKPGCRIRLDAAKTIGGMTAVPAKDCGSRIARLADVTSWHFAESGVSLNDATRKRVMLFVEDETTLLKTRGDQVPNYLMVKAPAGIDRAPHAPAIFGTWSMHRPGGPAICTVTFRDKPPPGGEESFALAIHPQCDPGVRKMRLASWRIEDFSLMVYGQAGESLKFVPAQGGAFEKAASEGGPPLLLVKAK